MQWLTAQENGLTVVTTHVSRSATWPLILTSFSVCTSVTGSATKRDVSTWFLSAAKACNHSTLLWSDCIPREQQQYNCWIQCQNQKLWNVAHVPFQHLCEKQMLSLQQLQQAQTWITKGNDVFTTPNESQSQKFRKMSWPPIYLFSFERLTAWNPATYHTCRKACRKDARWAMDVCLWLNHKESVTACSGWKICHAVVNAKFWAKYNKRLGQKCETQIVITRTKNSTRLSSGESAARSVHQQDSTCVCRRMCA